MVAAFGHFGPRGGFEAWKKLSARGPEVGLADAPLCSAETIALESADTTRGCFIWPLRAGFEAWQKLSARSPEVGVADATLCVAETMAFESADTARGCCICSLRAPRRVRSVAEVECAKPRSWARGRNLIFGRDDCARTRRYRSWLPHLATSGPTAGSKRGRS